MKHPDAMDADFVSWLEDATQASVPAAARERALASISSRRPRPARVAGLGSHWIAEPSPERHAIRRQPRPARLRRHVGAPAAGVGARPDRWSGIRRQPPGPAAARARTAPLRPRWRRLPCGPGWSQPCRGGLWRAGLGGHLGSRWPPLCVPSRRCAHQRFRRSRGRILREPPRLQWLPDHGPLIRLACSRGPTASANQHLRDRWCPPNRAPVTQ